MAILKIRDADGNVTEIPAIKGKSAYEYAKDGGYNGTEEEFAQLMANGSGGLVGTELTQAEYDALPEEEKNNGLYFITDGDNTTGVDYIVEQGTSGIWTYRKWNSGLAECWGIHTFTTKINTAWGSWYESASSQPQDYPISFVELPLVHYSPYGSSSTWFVETNGSSYNAKTSPPPLYASRPTELATDTQFQVAMRVIGRWK